MSSYLLKACGVVVIIRLITFSGEVWPVSDIDLDRQAKQVSELLAIEQQQLRAQRQGSHENETRLVTPNDRARTVPTPKLNAIYGVGKQLLAEFHIEGDTY